MRVRDRRPDPLDIELQRLEERRGRSEGMNRRAEIVTKARQRDLGGARASSDLPVRFEHENRQPALRERDGRRETVRSRADDDGVVLH